MASSSRSRRQSSYAITIKHEKESTVLHIVADATVDYVIKKAAASLELELDERQTLELVHQGDRLPKNDKMQDIFKDTSTTCCFLKNCKVAVTTFPSSKTSTIISEFGHCCGFCVKCKSVVQVRPIYSCSKCNKPGLIMDHPVKQFEDDLDQLKGACDKCQHVEARLSYECKASDEHEAMFLPHLRENVKTLPCMKCRKADSIIIRFTCGHTMCIMCFAILCQTKLDTDGFKTYPVGYSVCCPAEGPLCDSSPIADPHHFYIVDHDKKFYSQFKDKSFSVLQEEQKVLNETRCTKCHNRLDLVQMQEAEVIRPEGAPAPPTPGWGFSGLLRLLKLNSTQSQPIIMRRQIKCDTCQSLYCGECKLKWHEGDCNKMSKEEEAAATKFKVDPEAAKLSLWD